MRDFPAQGSKLLETADETRALGEKLGKALEAGDLIILDGSLGAGKTTFTQGIAQGMYVKGRVTSPTFIIAREHPSLASGPALVHVDVYRLLEQDDNEPNLSAALDSLDLDSDLSAAAVVAEWGGGLVEQISDSHLIIHIDRESAVLADPDSEARVVSWQWVEA